MSINLTTYDRDLSVNILQQLGFTILKNRKAFIEFKNKTEQTYVLSNSSCYEYHITVKNLGNTYGGWNRIESLLIWVSDNMNYFND